MRGHTHPRCTVAYLFSLGESGEESKSRKRLKKTSSCSTLYSQKGPVPTRRLLRQLGKVRQERTKFVDMGPEGWKAPPIHHAGVATVRRRTPARHQGISWYQARERKWTSALRVGAREKQVSGCKCEEGREYVVLLAGGDSVLRRMFVREMCAGSGVCICVSYGYT
jgi:hypothetical protein